MANKAKVDVQALAKIDLGPQSDDSASMMNCWCCSGAAPLLALPGYPPQLHNPPTLLAACCRHLPTTSPRRASYGLRSIPVPLRWPEFITLSA
jgi:hypothetical protein